MRVALLFSLLLTGSAVAASDPFEEQLNQLRGVLAGFKGTQVRAVGNVALVEGELDEVADVERLNAIVTALTPAAQLETKLHVQSVVSVSKAGREKFTEELRRDIGGANIRLRWVRDTLILEGNAESDFEADRAAELAKIGLGIGNDNGVWKKSRIVDMMKIGKAPRAKKESRGAAPRAGAKKKAPATGVAPTKAPQ